MSAKRYFEILEIQPTKNAKVIKKAFRRLAFKYHPDRNKTEEAHVKFIQLSEAYENLIAAIDHAKLSPDERKEQAPKRSNRTTKYSTNYSSKDLAEERLKQARHRYEEMRRKEQEENEAYYKEISSGNNWKVFRWVMTGCLILAVLFLIDNLFLPSRWIKSEAIGTNRIINYGGIHHNRVVPLQLKTGEKVWVKPSFASSASSCNIVYIERSFFFKDIQKIWVWEDGKWFDSHADFTVTGTFPIVPIFLFLPFITFILKGKTLTYSLLFNVSIYFYSLLLIGLLYNNDRWAHILTLGLL
jgi:hypothetical protein